MKEKPFRSSSFRAAGRKAAITARSQASRGVAKAAAFRRGRECRVRFVVAVTSLRSSLGAVAL